MRTGPVRIAGIVAAATFLLVGTAGAVLSAEMREPKVEYSADMTTTTDGMSVQGKVFHAKGKERTEMSLGESPMIAIMRMDKKVSWVLMPAQKQYMEMALGQEKDKPRDLRECPMALKKGGRESVNGIAAVRYEMEAKCPDSQFQGTAWITGDDILVKMDAKASDQTVKGARVVMELKNLKVGKQDPKLFEIPPGYTKFAMPSFDIPSMTEGAAAESRKAPARRGKKPADEEEESSEPSPPPREPANADKALEDAGKALRGIFGR